MNSEILKERQRILQAEQQQSYRERKRQIEKENTEPPKRTKEITDEIIEFQKHIFIHEFHLNYIIIY